MKALLDKGADPNARLTEEGLVLGYNFDQSGVDEIGATPFWRAAYGADVDAMKLLVAYGADPNIPTMKPAGASGDRRRRHAARVDAMSRACRRCRSAARRARRCRRPPASATAKASPATRIATRRTACWRR